MVLVPRVIFTRETLGKKKENNPMHIRKMNYFQDAIPVSFFGLRRQERNSRNVVVSTEMSTCRFD